MIWQISLWEYIKFNTRKICMADLPKGQGVFMPPFKSWLASNIPSVYDNTMTYYEELCALIKYLETQVVPALNHNAAAVTTISKALEQLKQYVDHYFENLDIQEEINNKLDQMVEDGTLEEIIGHYIQQPASKTENGTVKIGNGIAVTEDGTISRDYSSLKFHSVKASSATYIIQLPNGKNMIVDSGTSDQWDDVKDAIDSLGITKFDYAITTHFHPDHDGNNANLIETYDFSDCTWWIGMKPDYQHYSDRLEDGEAAYNAAVYTLTSRGISPIVPLNGSKVTLDEDAGIEIQFFNTDTNVAENYYSRIREYSTTGKINFNAFSLIANVTYGNQSILLTGDIESYVEEQYAKYMTKSTIMTAPHHGINIEAYEAFYTATSPEITICQYITSSANWIGSYYKEFYYITENSKKVITAYNSKSSNDLFSFEIDGDSVSSNVEDGGLTSTSPNFKLGSYIHVDSLIDLTTTARADITFKQLVINLPKGCRAEIPFYQVYATRYAQLVTDIKVFYPELHDDFVVTISKDETYIFITIREMYNDFKCDIHVSINDWNTYNVSYIISHYTTGSGFIYAENETQLLTKINNRPAGTYNFWYKDSSNSTLYNGTYSGILVMLNGNSQKNGYMTGHLRNTSVSSPKTTMSGFFNLAEETKFLFNAW